MKIYKYSSVKLAVLTILVKTFLYIFMSYSLTYLVADSLNELYRNILIVILIYVLHSLSMYVSMKSRALADFYVTMDMQQKIDKGMRKMGFEKFNRKDHGEHLSRYVNDVPQLINLVLSTSFDLFENGFLIFWTSVALFKVHYAILLLAIFSLLIMIFVPQIFQKRLSKYIDNLQKEKETYLSKMREFLQGYNTFIENSAIHRFLEKSRTASYNYALYGYKSESFAAIMSSVLTLVNSIMTILALGLLSYFVIKGKVNPGTYLVVVTLFPQYGNSVMTFLTKRAYIKSGQEFYSNNFLDFSDDNFDEEVFYKNIIIRDELKEIENIKKIGSFDIELIEYNDGTINFPDKKIKYPEKLSFKKGKKYVIMGESGSGKSTLIKILLGEIGDYQGELKLNGKDYNTNTIFGAASYVNQETFLFNDSIRNNIDIDSKLTDKEVMDLLHAMKLDDFRLDYIIKDNGKNLSGGQRQRIAIARAFARKNPFIILDEATANLDSKTTSIIEDYVLNTAETLIVITHNLSQRMKEAVDEIIILK